MKEVLQIYFLLLNTIAFILFYSDKKKAIKNRYRIPERTLFASCLFGGCFGGYLSMRLFHHKTQKPVFSLGVPLCMVLWICVGVWYMYEYL